MLSSLQKLSGRATVTALDEERFKDALWTYLANFKNRRTRILNPLTHDLARRPRSWTHTPTRGPMQPPQKITQLLHRGKVENRMIGNAV